MDHNHHRHHHADKFKNKAASLDNAKRREEFPPERLLEQIPIHENDTILDIGSGTGFLTMPAAKATNGVVYALDIDPNMLQVIDSKASDEELKNIRTVQGELKDLPVTDNAMDSVLASLVLHEIDPLSETLQQIHRLLKEGGYFACLELEEVEDSPHHHPRISSSQMEQELRQAGFKISKKFAPTNSLYVIIARKEN